MHTCVSDIVTSHCNSTCTCTTSLIGFLGEESLFNSGSPEPSTVFGMEYKLGKYCEEGKRWREMRGTKEEKRGRERKQGREESKLSDYLKNGNSSF